MARSLSHASATERVRSSCRRVAETARHVRIDSLALDAFAGRLADDPFALPTLDRNTHIDDDVEAGGERTVAFFMVLEAVNFGSGSFPALRHTSELSGYFTVAGAIARRFRELGPFTAAELAAIDLEACIHLFGQVDRPSARPLMAGFTEALIELGRHLADRWGGSFTTLLDAADHSAEQLVELLLALPGFRDEAVHQGERVYFYKRAQLASADLSLAFDNRGRGRFDDLDRLTIFADDLVPHVLRTEGVLIYSEDLARRVDAGELLVAGSEEEIEIRAGAITAADRMVAGLRDRGVEVDARRLDYRLWNLGLGPRYRAGRAHRTVSRFY
ncbi:MAG: queuosine salvage family protein [Acidobacteriota bacterium]